jgi:hypothetical protein
MWAHIQTQSQAYGQGSGNNLVTVRELKPTRENEFVYSVDQNWGESLNLFLTWPKQWHNLRKDETKVRKYKGKAMQGRDRAGKETKNLNEVDVLSVQEWTQKI